MDNVQPGTGLTPNVASGKSWTSHASGRVEIAANNGHNQASPEETPNPTQAELSIRILKAESLKPWQC
jgi:hypothetical protein